MTWGALGLLLSLVQSVSVTPVPVVARDREPVTWTVIGVANSLDPVEAAYLRIRLPRMLHGTAFIPTAIQFLGKHVSCQSPVFDTWTMYDVWTCAISGSQAALPTGPWMSLTGKVVTIDRNSEPMGATVMLLPPPLPLNTLCDHNGDGKINVLDLQLMINAGGVDLEKEVDSILRGSCLAQ